jgi:2-methylaconitate isomerase
MRGGTSKGIMLQRQHLPSEQEKWKNIFLHALGSPDPNGRQLDGMGGGVSSLSKICVIGPSTRSDADIDYTFAQVLVKQAHVDFNALCGNMTSAVGPYAVDEGLVRPSLVLAKVRIHNTNTRKIITAHFPMEEGRAAVDGDCEIPGVAGAGAPVFLEFEDPGGASTGKLFPAGPPTTELNIAGHGRIEVSMLDVSNGCVFVKANDLGATGTELPSEIEENTRLMSLLDKIRIAASIQMGIARDEPEARKKTTIPFIAFVAPPITAATLSGEKIEGSKVDFVARALSNGQAHRALPLSVSMCLAAAARIEGTVVHGVCSPNTQVAELRISMPSGELRASADVARNGSAWTVRRGGFYRTQRRLFEGNLLVRGQALQ